MFFFSSRRRHTRCALVTGGPDVCSSDLLVAPASRALAGPCVDEVEGDAGKGAARQPQRRQRLGGGMLPAEELQGGIVQRLHPKRQAVHPGAGESGEARGLGRGRVGLQGYLGAGGKRSEENTSELQSLMRNIVCRLPLEKKKTPSNT